MSNVKLDDQLRVKIALDYLAPLKEGEKPQSLTKLAEDTKLSEKTVAKAIREAFQNRLVLIEPRYIPTYRPDTDLSERLRRKFPHLREALVIEIAESIACQSDAVHKVLGYALAECIHKTRFFFRSGDVIGVGSGRGVHHVIAALNQLGSVTMGEISIMSLTGSLFIGKARQHEDLMMDADFHAPLLAQYFHGQITVRNICAPIAQGPSDTAKAIEDSWLGKSYADHVPDHVIVGVGVLAEGHRYYNEIMTDQSAPGLQSISLQLRELIRHVKRIRDESYSCGDIPFCPVGDVCNRLFAVEPPDCVPEDMRNLLKAEVKPIIDEINERQVTVRKTQLGNAKNVILVAGTRVKARAVLDLLQHKVMTVHTLCTDSAVAQALLTL